MPLSRLHQFNTLMQQPELRKPLKIADPTMKALKIKNRFDNTISFSQRQKSVYTRNIPEDRINNNLTDYLPNSARNAIHARSKTILQKRLMIGSDPHSFRN
jgi:hypothetical protein